MRYKKLFALIVSLSLLWIVAFPVFAAGAARVFADSVQSEPGKVMSVPVKIENNPGIMGFKLTFEYSSKVLESPRVQKSAVTKDGMMNDSITPQTHGSFDVVWSDSGETNENGVLLILQFSVKESAEIGDYEIKCSYSQEDTFNEKWKDVSLKTDNIKFSVKEPGEVSAVSAKAPSSVSETFSQEGTSAYSDEVLAKVDSRYVADVIKDALDEAGADSINDLDENQYPSFLERVSEAFSVYGLDEISSPGNPEDYDDLYSKAKEQAFIDSVLSSVDSDDVIGIVDDTLKQYKSASVTDMPETDRINFTADVISYLGEKGADIDDDEAPVIGAESINALYEAAIEAKNSGKEVKFEDSVASETDLKKWIIIAVAIIITGVFVVFAFKKITDKKHNIEEG